MTGGAHRLARGLAGLAGLAALLVGVPAGLMAAGESPAIHVSSVQAFRAGLFHPVGDSTMVRMSALACWLVWLIFVVAVVIEVVATVLARAGRARVRIRIPGLQGAASALLLSALLLLPQRGLDPVGSRAGGRAGMPAGAPIVLTANHPPGARSPRPLASPAASRAARYVVRRYDSPWRIAERHLGDGTRWRELRDESGRSLSLGSGAGPGRQARIIRPGEILLLPDGAAPTTARPEIRETPSRQAHAAPAASPAAPVAVDRPVVAAPATAGGGLVEAPEAAPAPAAASSAGPGTVGTSPVGPMVAATAAVPPPAGPDIAQVGDGVGAAAGDLGSLWASESPPSIAAPSSVIAVGLPGDGNRPPTMAAVAADRHTGRPLSTTLVGAGLLSAGVLASLQVMRRRQAQHRPAGRRLRLPGRALAATELALRLGAQPDLVDRVDLAMHRLVADLRQSETAAPGVLAVVASQSAIEILIDRPLAPPGEWTSVAEGFRWRIATAQLTPPLSPASAPLPSLVPVGKAGPDGPEVLLNLEAAGLVCVQGGSDAADAVVRAMATSLSGLGWAQAANLILVGFGSELEALPHIRAVETVGVVLDELGATAASMREVIGGTDPFAARVRLSGTDGWAPTVVFCTGSVDPADRAMVANLAGPGTGVVSVMASAGEASAWTIDVDSRPMAVQPLRLAVEPTLLPADELTLIGDLYGTAMDESGSSSNDPPYQDLDISVDRRPPTLAERLSRVESHATPVEPPTLAEGLSRVESHLVSVEPAQSSGPVNSQNGHVDASKHLARPERPICVSILGTVEIAGAAVFKRAKSKELAVYLALHPNGVGEAELDEALWPSSSGRLVAPSTRDSTVSVARTALGGPGRLLPAQGHGREKRYQLSADVGTDWSLFCQFHREGRTRRDPDLLRCALELVRGRPFEGVMAGRTYGWVHTEGHARHIEAEVADAADLAAQLLLASGQPIDARWAARRGLMADPYVERLWVRLMEGADQLGDGQEIERIMDEMDVVLELEGDFSGLHPNTLAAYDRFSRRRRLST